MLVVIMGMKSDIVIDVFKVDEVILVSGVLLVIGWCYSGSIGINGVVFSGFVI